MGRQQVTRTLEAQQQTLEQVLDSTLEKWASTVGDTWSMPGTETKESDAEDNVTTFSVFHGDQERRDATFRRSEYRFDTLKTHVDLRKLKLEFTRKQSALSLLSTEQSNVSRCWQMTDEASRHIVNCASRRRWHFDSLAAFVDGHRFRCFMASVVILNAAFIGFSTDVTLRKAIEDNDNSRSHADDDYATWQRLTRGDYSSLLGGELLFTTTFVLDICLRMLALEGEFFVGEEAGWNFFDSLLTLSSVAELILVGLRVDLSFLRVFRITGILRSFRVFSFLRLVPVMRSLRLMILAIVKSIVPFVLAVLILLEVIFVISVVIANGVAEYVIFSGDDISDDIRIYLGSMSMTTLSLFMSISGGIDWWTLGNVLLHISTAYLLLFLFFILFTVLAVLNVVTGIFVKEAQEMALKDRHVQLHQEFEENRQLLRNLKEIFNWMDEGGTGCVSLGDFVRILDQQAVRLRFAQVGLDIQDATTFFRILDQNDSEELSIEEFVMGCMRFKGRANRMDLEVMLMDTKKLMRKMAKMNEKFAERLGKIEHAVVKAS